MRSILGGRVIALGLATGLASLSLITLSGEAAASGYLTARFGSDHGTPAAPNPYAVYFNPAALGGVTGTQITGDLSLGARVVTYDRSKDALTPSSAPVAGDARYVDSNTGQAKLVNVVPLPFLGAASDLGTKNLRLGYALYVPFGGMAQWNKRSATEFAPGNVDGPQRWANISGQILAVYNTLAVAYRLPAHFSIGANVSVVYHKVETIRARNFDGSDDVRTLNGSLKEGRSLLAVSGMNLSASVGAYWEPNDDLKIGVSYTSQPGFGTTRMSGTLEQQFGTDAQRAAKTDVDLLQTYPDIIRLGGAFKPTKRSEVRLDGEFVRWSVFENQCVVNKGGDCNLAAPANVVLNLPRNWRNAYGVRLGGAFWPVEAVEVFGSVGLTTSAVPKETIDASTIDSTRFYGALGVRYAMSKTFAFAGSYNPIYFMPVDTKGASNLDTYSAASKSPSADGVYKSMIHLVNLNATVSF